MKRFIVAAIGLLAPLWGWSASVQLTFEGIPTTVQVGEAFSLKVIGSYDGDDLLLGGAVSIGFDANAFSVEVVQLLAPGDIAASNGTVDETGPIGTISAIGFASFDGVNGLFDLAQVTFKAKATVAQSTFFVRDAQDLIFTWTSENIPQVSVASATGSVAVVPEPLQWSLFGAGLLVIGATQTKRAARHWRAC